MLKIDTAPTADEAAVLAEIESTIETLKNSPVLAKYHVGIRRMFEGTSGVNTPTLARYLSVTNAPTKSEDVKALIAELRALKYVQTAYITPQASLPGGADFSKLQPGPPWVPPALE
jgi:hypothetical protein